MIIKKYKLLLAIVVTIVLFLFLNFGYFVATNWRNFLPKKAATLSPKPELKLYENQEYKFELKYPPTWVLEEKENIIEINPPAGKRQYNNTYFTLTPRKEFTSLDEVKRQLSPTLPFTPLELGQIEGFKYVDGGSYEVIWFKNKDTIYISRNYIPSADAEKIFESLKFKE